MKKPTYLDIARHAGVGTATVERVLNGRGGVRLETASRVVLSARKLDWPGRLPERHHGIVRIEVMLVRPETSFFSRIAAAFRRISSSLDRSIQIHLTFLDESDPEAISERIADLDARRSGLVIAAPGDPGIRAALSRVQAQGVPIVQIVSRNIEEADYVGIDNVAAGRTAGMLMSRLGRLDGSIIALCHSQIYAVHRDRIRGFSGYLAQATDADCRFQHVFFGHDDRDLSAACIEEAIATWPDLAGVYNAGGANAGVLRALVQARRKVFFIGHELTEFTSAALRDGTADVILDQLPETQARRATDLILFRLGLIEEPVETAPIRFMTITAENL